MVILDLINKILMILVFMSGFNILRHCFKIIKIVREEDIPNTYIIPTKELILLGLSIAYILTIVFTGIKI